MKGVLLHLRAFYRSIASRQTVEAEMDEEMRFHIELEAERLRRESGLDGPESLRQATIAFGGVAQRKEEGRDARGIGRMSGLGIDLKLAWRMLVKFPGLTAVGVLGIALGVAVHVGFFVVFMNLFNPQLPLEEGDRIVALENWDIEANSEATRSLHDFLTWREEMRSVEQIAAASIGSRTLATGDAAPQAVRSAAMTAAGFQVARVPPLIGRYLVTADEREESVPVAVIGYDLWQARFAGDAAALGRPILVGGVEHTVVGVMPAGFAFPETQELWTPLRTTSTGYDRGEGPEIFVFGRLAPGATMEQAQAELTALGNRAAAEFPGSNARLRPQVLPFTYPLDTARYVALSEVIGAQFMVNLLLMAIAVNIAVLVYARTAMRQGEIAVRTALGASRRRIVAQLFIEALLLSTFGAGLGLGAAHIVLRQMQAVYDPEGTPFWIDYGLQPRSIVFALALAVLSAVIVGVLPALKSTGRRLSADLRRLGTGASIRLGWAWTALIVAQVAVAVAALPTAAHLGYRTILMGAVRATFPAEEFLTSGVGLALPIDPALQGEGYRRATAARLEARLPELERRLEAEPEVVGVTFEGRVPDRGSLIEIAGASETGQPELASISATGVAADYLELLDLRSLGGRSLTAADADAAGGGIVLNEAFVRDVLAGGPALGRRLRFLPQLENGQLAEQESPGPWLEIVGIVEDPYASALDRDWAPPVLYSSVAPAQLEAPRLMIRLRDGTPADFAPRLRQIAAAVDPDLRLIGVEALPTMRNPRYITTAAAIIALTLLTVLLLSAAGIHALMSLTITRRRKEIGVRTALGAHPLRLLASIFSRAAWQLGLGGVVGSFLGSALLFGTGRSGGEAALFLGGVLALMLAVGLLATAGPARRGLRIQPMEALREE